MSEPFGPKPDRVTTSSPASEGNPFQQTRPLTVEKSQLVQRAAETLAERFEDELARWLSDSKVRAGPVEQTWIPELGADDIDLTVVKAKYHLTHGVIATDLHLALSLVSMLCGGLGEPVTELRPLSRLEMGVVDLVLQPLLALLAEQFETGSLELGNHVTHVSALPDSSPEPAIAIPLHVTVDNVEGAMTIGLTLGQLQSYSEELDRRIAGRLTSKSVVPNTMTVRAVRPIPVELIVGFQPMRVAAGQLAGLRVGDVLRTQQSVSKSLVARVGGQQIFRVRAAQRGQRLVAEVLGRIDIENAIETDEGIG